jgi:hypothetical protein
MSKSTLIMLGIIAVMFAGLVGLGVHVWHMHQTPAAAPGFQPTVEMKETKPLLRIKKQMTVPLVTIEKKSVEAKIKELPKEITDNPDKEYTATAEIAPNKGKTDVVSVTDMETGETKLIAKQEKQSFFGLPNEFFVGGRYGISTEGKKYTTYGGYSGLRIWVFTLSPYLSGSYLPEADKYKVKNIQGEAMLQGEFRW